MINKLRTLLETARTLTSDSLVRQATIALNRILLQHACITLAEWIVSQRITTPGPRNTRIPLPLAQLREPADGSLVSALSELLVAAENEGWSGVSRPFWRALDDERPASALADSRIPTLEQILRGFVRLRNDGVEGHGIPGGYNREVELDAVKAAIDGLHHILPVIDESGQAFVLTPPGYPVYQLQLLRPIHGKLICYRKIQKITGDRCRVIVQEQVELFKRSDITYEAPDILGFSEILTAPQYIIRKTSDESWNPLALIPDRLTNHFTGRQEELAELLDWLDDGDSRACLVYGDGGIGKTTLIVEFIHQLLEGEQNFTWKPEIITFYTAKQTRWGLNGLEVLNPHPITIIDTVTTIVRAFEDKPLTRDWFERDAEGLIQKLASYLQAWGVDRNNHLIILDNTETLVTKDDDIKLLARYIRELSRRVGRVLLTSRRREPIEASPIEITPLEVEQSVQLMQDRAKELKLKPINQAGIAKLNQFANKLGNKPLLLEVFLQALTDPNASLQGAFDRVLRMQRQDLGAFLYMDAWNRMSDSPQTQYLLLLMTRVSDIHDDVLLKLCCQEASVTVLDAHEALEESRGIASISTINDHTQIIFNPDFHKFCEGRTVTINGNKCPTEATIKKIRSRYNEFLRSSSSKVYDRVELAYRHALARAAWKANQDGRFDDAEMFYEDAIIADSKNGWLFDRYAYFLFSQRKYQQAVEKAKIATQQLPQEAEVWFTRGMIEGRAGLVDAAIISLNKAAGLGKPLHLCLIQEAHSYLHANPPNKARARQALDKAETSLAKDDPYYSRNIEEIQSLKNRAHIARWRYDIEISS